MNPLLAICIPTYNRAEVLQKNLSILISSIGKYDIPIYISDNASEDHTKSIVSRFQNEYTNIFYSANASNIGAIANFEKVLKMPDSRYRWLLGDDDTIANTDDLDSIIQCLNEDSPDVLVCGSVGPEKKVLYKDHKRILYNLAREMTEMSINIISGALIEKGNFSKYQDNDFPHLGVMLDYLFEEHGVLAYCYVPGLVITHVGNEDISFSENSTRVWSRGYAEMVLRLSCIDYETKLKYLHHTCKTGELNSLVRLASYRSWGGFSIKSLNENINYIRLFNYSPYFLLWFVAVFPSKPLYILRRILRRAGATTVTKWDEFD